MTPRRAVNLHNLYAFDAEDSSELSDLESSSVILLRLAEMDMTPCRQYSQDIEIWSLRYLKSSDRILIRSYPPVIIPHKVQKTDGDAL